MVSPILGIDHIIVEANDPSIVINSLKTKLGLIEAWPLQPSEYGYASGGLFAGNVNIEVIRFDNSTLKIKRPRYWGFALEPDGDIESAVARLNQRGISCGKPTKTRAYTTAELQGYSQPGATAFLCQYHFDTKQWRSDLIEASKREQSSTGIASVLEIIIESSESAIGRDGWAKLFGANNSGNSTWEFQKGPTVRLSPGDNDQIQSLVIEQQKSDNESTIEIMGSDL